MDRRQRKTREAIFAAFIELLSQKDFTQITVRDIIEQADISRAAFYAHFETKDFLLKELCEDLFCHILDATEHSQSAHSHIFSCDAPGDVFLHLFRHLLKNDNHILDLLSCQNSTLFLQYFKLSLQKLAVSQLPLFEARKNPRLPDSFWVDHISSTFVETVHWWIGHGMKESPETITEYFLSAV